MLHYTYDGRRCSAGGCGRDFASRFRATSTVMSMNTVRTVRSSRPTPCGPPGGAFSVMRYVENGRTAGVASEAGGTFVMDFRSRVHRERRAARPLMRDVLDFLLEQKDR